MYLPNWLKLDYWTYDCVPCVETNAYHREVSAYLGHPAATYLDSALGVISRKWAL